MPIKALLLSTSSIVLTAVSVLAGGNDEETPAMGVAAYGGVGHCNEIFSTSESPEGKLEFPTIHLGGDGKYYMSFMLEGEYFTGRTRPDSKSSFSMTCWRTGEGFFIHYRKPCEDFYVFERAFEKFLGAGSKEKA